MPNAALSRRRWCQAGLGLGTAWLVTACGFELRRAPDFAFQTLFCSLPDNQPIWLRLRRQLEASGKVEVITDVRQVERAQVLFEQLSDQRERVIVGRTATGVIREFQLRLRYRFRVRSYTGKELVPETSLVLTRDVSYNETGALSKESEEGLLFRDMEADLVQQIMRRLAAVLTL